MPMLDTAVVHEKEVASIGGGNVHPLHDVLDGFQGAVDEGLAL